MERILDSEHQELEDQLMRVGRDVQMSPALQAKTLAALAVGSTGLIGASSGAVSASAGKAGTLGWLGGKAGALWGVGLLAGAGVLSTVMWMNSSGDVRVPVAPGTPAQPTVPGPLVRSELSGDNIPDQQPRVQSDSVPPVELEGLDTPDDAAQTEPPRDAPRSVKPRAPRRGGSASPPAPGASSSSLGEELSAIAQVESSLRGGDPRAALAHLEQYRARFTRPQLGLEAEVLTIQALHESGAVDAARARAARFVERYPKSPLGVRAKQYLK